MTVAFLAWYLLYVLLSTYAPDFMATEVFGNVNIGLLLGLGQFVSTFVITHLYVAHANKQHRPDRRRDARAARAPRVRRCRAAGRDARRPPVVELLAADSGTIGEPGGQHLDLRRRSSWSRCSSRSGPAATTRAPRTTTRPAATSAAPRTAWPSPGDYLSAASFLGIAGAIAVYGYDGFLYSIGFLVAWLVALLLVAELMRNTARFTMADVLAFRMRQRPGAHGGGHLDPGRVAVLPAGPDGRAPAAWSPCCSASAARRRRPSSSRSSAR